MSTIPPPPRDYALDGSCRAGRYRIRPVFFFGFCVLEELVEYRDGRSAWEKCNWTTGFSLTREAAK